MTASKLSDAKVATVAHLTAPTAEPVAEWCIITPDVAREIVLQHRAKNRTVTPATYAPYLSDMINDRWWLNGAPVAFDVDGQLIDGQHRLHGLAEAGDLGHLADGVPFLVNRGLPHGAMDTMDTNRRRTFADQVNIALPNDAEKIGTKVAAAIRALYLFGQAGSYNKLGGGRLTSAQQQALYHEHAKIMDSVKLVYGDVDGKTITTRPAVVAALHYAVSHLITGSRADIKEAKAKLASFIDVLRTGVPGEHGKDDPALAMREVFRVKGASENDALKYIGWAWEYYRKGEPMSEATLLLNANGRNYGKKSERRAGRAQPIMDAGADAETAVNAERVNGAAALDVAALRQAKADAKAKAESDAKEAAKAQTEADVGEGKASEPLPEPKAKKATRKGASKAATAKARARATKPSSANAHAAESDKEREERLAIEAAARERANMGNASDSDPDAGKLLMGQ